MLTRAKQCHRYLPNGLVILLFLQLYLALWTFAGNIKYPNRYVFSIMFPMSNLSSLSLVNCMRLISRRSEGWASAQHLHLLEL